MMAFPRTVILLLVLALGGCSRILPSRDLQLSEMSFQMAVLGRSASEAEAAVVIKPGGAAGVFRERVDLSGGDRIVAEVDGQRYDLAGPVRLSKGNTGYRTTVPASAPGTRVRILFARPGRPDTPIGSGTLPKPFELAELPRSPSASRPLEVRWAPVSSDPMEIAVKGSCLSQTTLWMGEDPGLGVLEAGLLRPPVFKWNDCQVDLTVGRVGDGRPERGIHPGSSFVIRQERMARLEPVR
ncbi:MAG TPA: hypothetical protein VN493_07505 [Thermoanaerobaculia bacterium]|nr:hypothetical protein [Thermoanaerobaculia bacterium]